MKKITQSNLKYSGNKKQKGGSRRKEEKKLKKAKSRKN